MFAFLLYFIYFWFTKNLINEKSKITLHLHSNLFNFWNSNFYIFCYWLFEKIHIYNTYGFFLFCYDISNHCFKKKKNSSLEIFKLTFKKSLHYFKIVFSFIVTLYNILNVFIFYFYFNLWFSSIIFVFTMMLRWKSSCLG